MHINKRQRVEFGNFLKLHYTRAPLLLSSVLQPQKSRGKAKIQLFPGKGPTTAQHQPAESPKNWRNTPKATPGHKCGALGSVGRACPPRPPPAHPGAQGR